MECLLHRIRLLFLCLALVFLCGCASQKHILFGIYAVPLKNLPAAREIGFDFVVGPSEEKYLAAAKDSNLKVIGSGPKFFSDSTLIGNYLTDEPDLYDIPPDRIATEFRAAKRRSSKPVFLNLSSAYSFESYGAYSDIPMFDWYPIGWQPIETYYSNLRIARLAAGKKPFFCVVQVFDWSLYPKLMPPSKLYRPPTGPEVKAMTLWAAMSGAAGIAFYPFDDGTSRLNDSPDLVAAIQESIRLVRENEPYFNGPRVWAPYPFHFQNESDKTNAVTETSITVKFSRDPGGPQKLLVVAANTTPRNIVVTIEPSFQIADVGPSLEFVPFEVKLLRASLSPPK